MPRSAIMAGLVCLLSLVAHSVWAIDHTQDKPETVKSNLKDGKALLLDVRELSEWDAGHLQDAKLMPLNKLKAGIDPQELAALVPKGKIVYCHCKAGRRALVAGEILEKLGYDVRPLKLGYDELLKAGFPKAEK